MKFKSVVYQAALVLHTMREYEERNKCKLDHIFGKLFLVNVIDHCKKSKLKMGVQKQSIPFCKSEKKEFQSK